MKTSRFKLVAVAGLASMLATSVVHAAPAAAAATTYVAHLRPMNSSVAGSEASGEARFTVVGDRLTIAVDMKGVPPGVEHWQHFHGFKDGHDAACPTAAADVNHDGIVDLIETEAAAGQTMVPFNADPAAMDVASDTYPKASAAGAFHYRKTVSMKAMTAAFGKAFGTPDLDLDRRVVFVHGVAARSALAPSVASLGPVPAHVTLPIACGTIERAAS